MGRRGYPPEFRRKVLDLVEAGSPVVEVARDLGISAQSIYVWRKQDRIEKRLEPGLSSAERSELSAAKRRIAELETELAVHRRASELPDYPPGTRVIVRWERPHPGAQLDLMETRDGWRYTAFATDTGAGQLAWLDARHRAHARVEDRIRCGKDSGLDHFPSRTFQINQAWLGVVMLAVDLLAWTQHLLLDGDLAKAEPKTLRYRLLHVAACLTHGQRRIRVRIQQSRPDHAPLTPGAPGRPASRTTLQARSQKPAQTGPTDLQEDHQ